MASSHLLAGLERDRLEPAEGNMDEMVCGLYIHIPFCRSRCAYCDFNTYAGKDSLLPAYVDALCQEIARAPSLKAATVYFGGGTPSLLSAPQVSQLLAALRDRFYLPYEPEVTLEANPGTLTEGYLEGLRQVGANRLSLGAQSFDPGELCLLGRSHRMADIYRAVAQARAEGFDSLNLDLIYGLPHQSLEAWKLSLGQALELSADHLALYCLTLEEDTPLGKAVARGELPPPDPDLAADMYLHAEERLLQAGYRHYELSNWAKPGKECRHNLVYWRNQPYLGFGAGAHSCFGGYRFANIPSPENYISRIASGTSPEAFREAVSPELERAETVILGLRLVEGVDDASFRRRYGVSLFPGYAAQIAELEGLGLVEREGERLRLTARGRLLGNEAFIRFLPAPKAGAPS